MPEKAEIYSIDALRTFAAALRRFVDEARAALDELNMEVERGRQWVQLDQKEYWREQVRRGYEQVAEARINLERKLVLDFGQDKPSVQHERIALEAAKRRLRHAEEKVDAVKHWSRVVEQELDDYRGGVAPLANWLEVDGPRAIARLHRLANALDLYAMRPAGSAADLAALVSQAFEAGETEEKEKETVDASRGPDGRTGQAPADDGRLPQRPDPGAGGLE